MIIKRFEVSGLSGRDGITASPLYSDLNIVTGRNGSGKTTLLKLLWYVVSGNIEHAVREVSFQRALIETDIYTITIFKITPTKCRVELQVGNDKFILEDESEDEDPSYISAEFRANNIIADHGSSVFFPTFRRIEGGFSLGGNRSLPSSRSPRGGTALEEALIALSRKMTVENHTFVSSISTVDIVGLLMKRYTEMSELANDLQKSTSQHVIDRIKEFKYDSHADLSGKRAEGVLDNIRTMIEDMDLRRETILSPLKAVQNLAEKLFQHAGIMMNSRISFGDAANAVSSDTLSAGEKQMLSFICYNAFYDNSIIFIDEPELSLHVDWQRQLFPIMQAQGTSNQFVIATHSPFIYSKYPEKELILSADRGESNGGFA